MQHDGDVERGAKPLEFCVELARRSTSYHSGRRRRGDHRVDDNYSPTVENEAVGTALDAVDIAAFPLVGFDRATVVGLGALGLSLLRMSVPTKVEQSKAFSLACALRSVVISDFDHDHASSGAG